MQCPFTFASGDAQLFRVMQGCIAQPQIDMHPVLGENLPKFPLSKA
jgi:hypothetical protein